VIEGPDPGIAMTPNFYPRQVVAGRLSVSTATLLRYERRGLVRVVREGDVEGYDPAEIRRLWMILSFHRDLGINLAGVEVILRLREQMDATHARLEDLARSLVEALDEGGGPDDEA